MGYEELTDAQKAKARECKTPEEIMALAQSEGYELSDEELEALGASGGWCPTDQQACPDKCGCLCPRV